MQTNESSQTLAVKSSLKALRKRREGGLGFKIQASHFLTGTELSKTELLSLLDLAERFRKERRQLSAKQPLAGQQVALLFEKPSLRTRMSFSIAVQELGGAVVESNSGNSKFEEPEDVARVLGGYVHGIMLRTFDQKTLERMAGVSAIPVVNGLSDTHHPCQILADLLTVKQRYGTFDGLTISYVGDGNNILHSLLLMAPLAGLNVNYSCPRGYEPSPSIVAEAKARALAEGSGKIQSFDSPLDAVKGTHAIYTDVWASMGFEAEAELREKAFEGFQVNAALYQQALEGALIMHCLPMIRGKEITDEMADHPCSAIFQQSENRLHVQKALLVGLMGA